MRQRRPQEDGFKAEHRFCQRYGIDEVAGSGSGKRKGDGITPTYFYQIKSTDKARFRLTQLVIDQAEKEAMQLDRLPRVAVTFTGTGLPDVDVVFVRKVDHPDMDLVPMPEWWYTSIGFTRQEILAGKLLKVVVGGRGWIGVPKHRFPSFPMI